VTDRLFVRQWTGVSPRPSQPGGACDCTAASCTYAASVAVSFDLQLSSGKLDESFDGVTILTAVSAITSGNVHLTQTP
jgi:hypothetical protein